LDHILLKLREASSIRSLAQSKKSKEEELHLLLGEKSVGGLLEKFGISCTPGM
jgi:hypothetical protein